MIEYILIAGVNDTPTCAELLGRLLKDRNVMLNLIPVRCQWRERASRVAGHAFRQRFRELAAASDELQVAHPLGVAVALEFAHALPPAALEKS